MSLPILRIATIEDLPFFVQFAKEASFGITSLPRNEALLAQRLKDTHHSFLFCLEWEKEIIGISGVISRIATNEPFFAYHLLYEPLKSSFLNIKREVPVLHFVRARKKPTEIGSLYLKKEFRKKQFGKLLSLARFLFIATFRQQFASTVIGELRGINIEGVSPFWDHVGRLFFNVDFPQADFLRFEHSECIEELFPKHTLYIELLPKEAQEAIGSIHQNTMPALKMLEKQGFKLSHYVDLFDGGPHVFAHTDEIHAVRHSQLGMIKELRSNIESHTTAIIATTDLNYRATVAPVIVEEQNALIMHPHVGFTLKVDVGDTIRFYLL